MTFNEEQFIKECIEHHLPYVDEMIILDNGSTDRTVEIAESLGVTVIVKVLKTPCDSRNYMQTLSKYDWCLHIDADELFEIKFMQVMKGMLGANPTRNVVYLPRFNLPFGNNWPDKQARLVNKSRVEWIRPIHEIVTVIGGTEPFDSTHATEIVALSSPVIFHRVNDREPKHRIERLKNWMLMVYNNPDYFDDVEWEMKHLRKEIAACEKRI